MNIKHLNVAECALIHDDDLCSANHLIRASGLSEQELEELIDSGIITPVTDDAESISFQLRSVTIACTARRLRDDFELDYRGMTLAMTLMRRIEELTEELHATRAHLGSGPF